MKRILFAALLLVLPLIGHAQKALFDKYGDMDEVQTVYITKAMLNTTGGKFIGDVAIAQVKGQLNCVQVLSTQSPDLKEEMRKDFRDIVKSGNYELLMKQKKAASSSEIYMLQEGDKVKELITFKDGAASLKIICIEGDMTMRDVNQILMFNN